MKQINKDITGDNTIGYEGVCIWCKQLQRAYYMYADSVRKAVMKSGTFMDMAAHCPPCMSKLGTPNSMRWKRKLTQEEVVHDLTVYERGGGINFEAAKDKMRENEKMDQTLEEEEYKIEEMKKWKSKKD